MGLFAVSSANAVEGLATLGGSSFEIDDDANLTNNNGEGYTDWEDLAHPDGPELRATDLPTGRDDNSYKGGVKEDTVCPGEVTGSIPNNKSDLLTFHVYVEPGESGHPGFLDLAWSRVSDPSGTTLMDFEFNQSTTACPEGPNVVRTDGDLLIEYAIDQGGARADISGRWWDAAAGVWGPSVDLDTNNPACDGAPCAVGTISNSAIPADDSDGLVTAPDEKEPRTFGEAQIDLRLMFDAQKCTSFGSAMLKSRSSDSFTSQLKDFISPVPIDLQNCGNVIIRKQTNPDEDPNTTEFGFTKSFSTYPATDDTFTLTDDGVKDFNDDVLFGTGYTVDEASLGDGYEFGSVNCSASSGVVPTIDGSKVTFDIDSASDVLDCTYTNKALATFTVKKVLDPPTSAEAFGFTAGVPLSPSSFSLGHNATQVFSDLAPGEVTVTETAKSGWDLASVVCTDASGATKTNSGSGATATVTLEPGDDVTCTYTNRQRAEIVIIKVDDAGAPLVGAGFTATAADQQDATCTTALVDHDGDATTPDRAQCTLGNLVPNVEYTVSETTVPAGYQKAPDQTVTPTPGQTVELTFTDYRLFKIITFVCQESDNALYGASAGFGLAQDPAAPPTPEEATQAEIPEALQNLLAEGVTPEQVQAALCGLDANFSGLTAGTYHGSVTIN